MAHFNAEDESELDDRRVLEIRQKSLGGLKSHIVIREYSITGGAFDARTVCLQTHVIRPGESHDNLVHLMPKFEARYDFLLIASLDFTRRHLQREASPTASPVSPTIQKRCLPLLVAHSPVPQRYQQTASSLSRG